MMISNVSGMFEPSVSQAIQTLLCKNLKRRAHLNDMENIYPFVFLSLLAVLQNLGTRLMFLYFIKDSRAWNKLMWSLK